MPEFFKATRPDGRDFHTGTIDYGAALVSGEVIRHPAARMVRDDPATYLSVSTSPSDCTGFFWPCCLFRVEPVGRVMGGGNMPPHKRACRALRVVEELPAWQAFGPNGEAVVALLERAWRLSADELDRLAPQAAALTAAQAAAAALHATWDVARGAARGAAWVTARTVAWDAPAAARDAAGALLARDLITPEQFDILTMPWRDAGLPL